MSVMRRPTGVIVEQLFVMERSAHMMFGEKIEKDMIQKYRIQVSKVIFESLEAKMLSHGGMYGIRRKMEHADGIRGGCMV